jgi:hypothetical protein
VGACLVLLNSKKRQSMGLAYSRIKFDTSFPSLVEIQSQFFKQTGLNLWVTATLNVDQINLSYSEMIFLLYRDSPQVHHLQTEYNKAKQADPQNYEKLAQVRDVTLKVLGKLNRLDEFQFQISQFYGLDFRIMNNVIEIESYVGQYYGIISLNKSLIDLDGKFLDSEKGHPIKWKKLKKWDEYKWYNRPRK